MAGGRAEWDPDVEIDADLASALAGRPASPYAQGWDKTVFLAGHELIAFCRRGVAVEGMRREIALLAALAPRLPLALPMPLRHGTFGDNAWPWWSMRRLPGRELLREESVSLEQVGRDVGRFLRALHDLPPPVPLPVDPMSRSDAGRRGRMARDRLDRLGLPAPAILDSDLGPSQGRPVLSHGDLHARHVLVHEGRCSGVIDWGDVCLADPAVDLSLAYTGFEGPARAALLSEYGHVSPEQQVRARVLGIFLSSALAETAASHGDDSAFAGALRGIARAQA